MNLESKKYMQEREDKTYVLQGEATIENEEKQSLKDKMKVIIQEDSTEKLVILELPYIFYHGYTTKLNGKNIKNYESENGFLCIDIKESGTLEVEYIGTTLEKIGYAVSGVSLIILLCYYCIRTR